MSNIWPGCKFGTVSRILHQEHFVPSCYGLSKSWEWVKVLFYPFKGLNHHGFCRRLTDTKAFMWFATAGFLSTMTVDWLNVKKIETSLTFFFFLKHLGLFVIYFVNECFVVGCYVMVLLLQPSWDQISLCLNHNLKWLYGTCIVLTFSKQT